MAGSKTVLAVGPGKHVIGYFFWFVSIEEVSMECIVDLILMHIYM